MLSEKFLKNLDEQVGATLQHNKNFKPSKAAQNMWKYEDASDFWYSHTFGMISGVTTQLFMKTYGREPRSIEINVILERISRYGDKFRATFSRLKDKQ